MSATPRIVLLMDAIAGYDRGLADGITRYSQIHGPWEFLLPGENPAIPWPFPESIGNQEIEAAVPTGILGSTVFPLRRLNANGIIGRIQTPTIARIVLASGLPTIGIDLRKMQVTCKSHKKKVSLSSISEICDEGVQVGRIAAEHLLGRGFTQFGFCGYQGRTWSDRRQENFCAYIEKNACVCHVYARPEGSADLPWPLEQGFVADWLRSLPKPVGVLACNDLRGRQVIDACRQAGLRVPDDVAVLGVDDDRLFCEMANPPLSSVALNLEHAGYQAAELLDGLMSGRVHEPQRIRIQATWVVERPSTSLMVVDDEDLASALRFIRDHFRQAITVDDVVNEAGLSRRTLELRFQRRLGRSIRQEIRRARLDWSKKLLGETNLSMEKIAELAGFCDANYMCHVFQDQLHMTPTDCRRRSRNP